LTLVALVIANNAQVHLINFWVKEIKDPIKTQISVNQENQLKLSGKIQRQLDS
jgi:hypothetical protein